ncbi:MAG TPA: haloalkane dehalogenase [Acidimicrobiales bacterium]|jgi:haloalkane dehalogenase|nr:haloalkane dehalogenase [Acidimicrobiales bacterium]
MEVLRTPRSRFDDLADFPFDPAFITLRDELQMHYVEAGPVDGEPVVLLHGQPTWSYLYRHVMPVLAEHGFRALAPDLIGYGQSDKPASRSAYSVRNHIGWLHEFFEQLDLEGVTMVVQDWGGPVGLAVLARDPDRMARVVATNTVLHTADRSLEGALTWACHSDSTGHVVVESALLDYQRLTQELPEFHPSLFVQGATVSEVGDEALAAYDAPFPDETYCAGPRQLPLLMGLSPGSSCARQNQKTLAALAGFDRPFLTAFSDSDPSTAGWERIFQERIPGTAGQAHTTIAGAGHFVQEDQGTELGRIVVQFARDNPIP